MYTTYQLILKCNLFLIFRIIKNTINIFSKLVLNWNFSNSDVENKLQISVHVCNWINYYFLKLIFNYMVSTYKIDSFVIYAIKNIRI